MPLLSTILADSAISAAGSAFDGDAEPPDIDQQLEFGLPDIRHAQRRMRDVVVLETFDQPRLDQFRNRIGPHCLCKSGYSCGGENRKRWVSSIATAVGSGIAHCTLMTLPTDPDSAARADHR